MKFIMKPLLPALRERKRYISFRVLCEKELEKDIISKCVNQACLQFLGELGMAKAGIQFLPESWNTKSQTGIIRVGHKYVDEVKFSLDLLKEIDDERATVNCIKVSGSIGKVK